MHLLLTQNYPYREEPEARLLLEELLRQGLVVTIFPVDGIRKPYYRQKVPVLPQGVQVWNCPDIGFWTTLSRAWFLYSRKDLKLLSMREAYRVAGILLGIERIVGQLDITGFDAVEGSIAQKALVVAYELGLIGKMHRDRT